MKNDIQKIESLLEVNSFSLSTKIDAMIPVQSELHFQTLAPLAQIEKGAIYSSYNLLLALGHMTIAMSTGNIQFVLTVENLKGRLSCLLDDQNEVMDCDEFQLFKRDIEDTRHLIKKNKEILEGWL